MRPVVALVLKELQHHLLPVAGMSALVLSALVTAFAFVLQEQQPTLLVAASGWVYYMVPLLAMYVFRRLIVLEREDQTHDFLASLPISPLVVGSVRWMLGVLAVVPLSLVGLMVVAWAVGRHERLGGVWLAQLACQVGLYTLGWCSVCFLVAHLGRFRWVVWLGGMEATWALGMLWPELWTHVLWHGVLVDPITVTRLLPPWGALPAAFLWIVGGVGLGLGLGSWHGGVWPTRWYLPAVGVARTQVVLLIAACWVGGTVIEQSLERWTSSHSVPAVPAARARIAVGAGPGRSLRVAVDHASADLDALGTALGVDAWPDAIVVPDPTLRIATSSSGHHPLTIRARGGAAPHELTRSMVGDVLFARTSGFYRRDDDATWMLLGAAAWWRSGPGCTTPDPDLPARAAFAVGSPTQPRRTLGDLGGVIGEAWAWQGLCALEDLAGRRAVLAALTHVLGPEPGPDALGALYMRRVLREGWLEAVTGVVPAELHDRWVARLTALGARAEAWPTPTRAADLVAARIGLDGAPRPGDELCWVELDPLRPWPEFTAECVPAFPPPAGETIGLLVDPRSRIAVRVQRFDAIASAWIGSPWTVLEVAP